MRHDKTKTVPQLLILADYHDPILRTVTEEVHFPLSEEDKHIINSMIYSIQPSQLKKANAPWEAAVGMAANQWGINKRIFLYCPDGDTVNGLEVIINPNYEPIYESIHEQTNEPIHGHIHEAISKSEKEMGVDDSRKMDMEKDLCWEGCFSVPLAAGNVARYTHIKVKYQNIHGDVIEKELQGWSARVWQHENDHLNGFLYDDVNAGKCIDKRTFASIEEIDQFYAALREERKEKYSKE